METKDKKRFSPMALCFFGCGGLLLGIFLLFVMGGLFFALSDVQMGPQGINIKDPLGSHIQLGPHGIVKTHRMNVSMLIFPILGMFSLAAIVVGAAALIIFLVKQLNNTENGQKPTLPTKFCTHCGGELCEGAYACPKCGFATRAKRDYCFNCGVKTDAEQILCVQCGVSLKRSAFADVPVISGKKDKLTTGLLALFLGCFGIHKFYLESWGWGIVYFLIGPISFILGVIEGLIFLTMDKETFDRKYNQTEPSPFRF